MTDNTASETPDLSISNITIEEEMKNSYLDYAMSVIVSRALPDVRDGLKPVHRRILYSMYENNYDWTKPYRKSARVVGDVMGKYHPHGDSAIYDAMVRMAQDFSLRLPLIDGQGNFGSMDGDPPAAMRYTEARMAKTASGLLEDIDKDTVTFQPNYDESEHEPTVLPARFPNILVNGAGGIAVGMATNIPPHNLGELLDACCAYIDNPEISLEELVEIVPGPDFPTGGLIMGGAGSRSAEMTGRGSVIMRGRTHIEEFKKDREAIIITEVPYQVNKSRMIENFVDCVKTKKIEGISDIRDESDRDGVRVVVEVKRDSVADVVLNQLFRYTPLQTSFGANMLALSGGRPQVLNLHNVIEQFVRFREEVITRRTKYKLGKARDRAHLLVGLVIAVNNLDKVVAMIRKAPNPAAAREALLAEDWDAVDVSGYIELINEPGRMIVDGKYKLSEKTFLSIRQQYLEALSRFNVPEDVITDKMPLNCQYIGFILSAFPEAKIVHIKRDARATCWSIYKHYFSSAGNGWAYNLDDLAGFYGIYSNIMDFWHQTFPDKIYDLCYEDLTTNQEEETKKLLQYCELDWDENCLNFHTNKRAVKTASSLQVRQKM